MSQQSKGEATMNCVYIRISTVGQNEAGQRAEIDKWLAGNGIADAA
jgi:DNA invertase Pin-like site-specific DNA recombinase